MRWMTRHAGAARWYGCLLQAALTTAAAGIGAAGVAHAQAVQAQPQLDARFSCSAEHAEDRLRDGDRRLYADSGAFRLRGNAILAFYWESSLFRSNHGSDCSIDEGDGVVAELLPTTHADSQGWRVRLRDARTARTQRGYDADHGFNCSIRLVHAGDMLQIIPSCPALCGSRENFSALTVDLKNGGCTYED